MIQIYSPTNTNFDKNGDAVLFPISCTVSPELNGAWLNDITVPVDEEGRYKLIEVGAVIKAPSINGEQLFRIRRTEKQDSGITATAEPIFLDAAGDCFILDVRPTNKTGQQALDDILSPNSKYSAKSDITTRATAYFIRKNAMEAIAGTEDVSFLQRWGGEIIYNNFEIIINERTGADYGVSLLYGKNIPTDGLKESVDMEGVVTRIIPKAYNGYTLAGSSPWVDSPIIGTYPTVFTKVIEYENIRLYSDVEGDDTEGLTICQNMTQLYAALRQAAAEEFQNGIDKPTVTIEANLVLLENTEEYKAYKDLEKVSLGDTIHLKHKKLGIESTARVIALTYDSIQKAVVSVVIGDFIPSFIDRVASTVAATEKAITKAGDVKAEKVKGFIDGVQTQLRIQSTTAEPQSATAILFEDLDENSPTYGASAYGTKGWQISSERTADGRGWVWTTAATSKGIIADTISAGTLSAIDISGVNITGSNITGTTISGNTISGGAISGTTVTGTSISGGTITGTVINNGSGTFQVDANGNLIANSATINGDITSGSTISGATISGGSITGTIITGGSVHTTGDIDSSDTTQGDVWVSQGHVQCFTKDENDIDCKGTMNGQWVQVGKLSGSTTTSFSNIQSSGRIIANDGTYAARTNYTSGQFQISKVSGDENNIITLNAPTGRLNLRGNAATQIIDLNANNRQLTIVGKATGAQLAFGFQTNYYGYYWDGSAYKWRTNYISGDSVTYGFATFAGHVTNSTRSIDFFIPLNTSAAGRTASISIPSDCSVRTISGYIDGAQYLSSTDKTLTIQCRDNGIYVRITKSSAYTNVTNNTPVTVAGSFVITFTA